MKKFLILTQSYSENDGGYIALHKLCDQINELGGSAYLHPYIDSFEFSSRNFVIPILKFGKERLRRLKKFKTNLAFKTPVMSSLSKIESWDDWIVVYPEVVFGNPLKAKHVVRWFLHNPGHITGKIYYGRGELYFRYHSGIKGQINSASKISKNELKIVHYPLEHYNENGVSESRKGTAYCIRKGKGKKIVHDLGDSILIDGKSHAEVAQIFKHVKRFISYDVYTAYSHFAAICGCESVVIPDDGVSETDWLPDSRDRYGLAYGFEKLDFSQATRSLLLEKIASEHQKNLVNTRLFMDESIEFFNKAKMTNGVGY